MKSLAVVLMFSLVVLAMPVGADMCSLDAVPAATLLLPYFEVDLDDPDGVNTLFSVNNAAPEPALAHLIFWTDWSVPTIDFDVFLTGYDVVTFDLRDVFENGNIPITADEQSDPDDTISPQGDPLWDGSFDNCENFFPFFVNPVITGTILDRIVSGHTGAPVAHIGSQCMGADHGDNVARGYITIDSTNECSLVFDPAELYFVDGGTGVASNRNVLWGDYFYVDPAGGTMVAQSLVHIEADSAFNADSTPTGYTFYGTYLEGTGADNREPLGTVWGARYFDGGALGSTELVVWRDTTDSDILSSGVACGVDPGRFPLDAAQIVCFDEMEAGVELCGGLAETTCFPHATQRSPAGDLEMPYSSGWCLLDLNHDCPTCSPGGFGPEGDVAQSYVAAIHGVAGQYAGGLPALELAHACGTQDPPIVGPPFFTDGFESGDLSGWSATLP